MTQEERIQAFELLGKSLDDQPANECQSLAENVRQENPWFTEANVRMAVNGVRKLLQSDGLRKWVANYDLAMEPKVIAVVMQFKGYGADEVYHNPSCRDRTSIP